MLPVITYALGPKDIGTFALVTAFTAFGTTIATMGSGYILAAKYSLIDILQKQRMVSTMLGVGIAVALSFAAVFFTLWFFLFKHWDSFAVVPWEGIALSLAAMICTIPWTIAVDVITLKGTARLYAITVIAQSIVSAITVIVSLYIFELGLLSLFLAAATGSCVICAGGIIALKPYIRFTFSKNCVKEVLNFGAVITVSAVFENLQMLVERYMLSVYAGLSQLGIYSHSQQYRNMTAMIAKAAARSIWPTTLSEAHESESNFYKTRKTWNLIYIGITISGLLFALFGKDIIGLLTHNKFIDAYSFVTMWMIFLLIQNAGRPETGILYARGQGALYGKITIWSFAIGISFVLILVPAIGAFGAVFSVILQQIILRIFIHIYAKKNCKILFSNQWVLVGSFLILLAFGTSKYFKLTTFGSLMFFFALLTIIIFLSKDIFSEIFLKSITYVKVIIQKLTMWNSMCV